jgi:uncharacterized protein with ParB-like and HNH nuclease domain
MHFLGVIYFGKDKKIDNNRFNPIMDGQQRFLTILLILKELEFSPLPTVFLFNVGNQNKLIEIFPKCQKNNDNIVREYSNNIRKNERVIKELIKDIIFEKRKDEIKEKILNNLNVIVVKCIDESVENEIFVNLNSKGRPLDHIDNIKSHIISNYQRGGTDTFRKQ